MYLKHWQLERPPFAAPPDSRFWFPTPAHERALAALRYAVHEGGEPALVCGPPGCGKTLLLRVLRRQLPREQYRVAFVPEAGGAQAGLLRRVAHHLTHTLAPDDAAAMDALLRTAAEAEKNAQTVVLLLDDWPAEIEADLAHALRWLLTMEEENQSWRVLLGGASDPARRGWPDWLAQRLFAALPVGPLTEEQTALYLEHRLRIAGRAGEAAFAPAAARLIAQWAGGAPRRVNRAAQLALHVGFLHAARQITADAARRAIARLDGTEEAAGDLPGPARQEQPAAFVGSSAVNAGGAPGEPA